MGTGAVFIDTSVLCNLVRVHGKDQHSEQISAEMQRRMSEGDMFILPVTAVIETGNHIAQSTNHRYEAAHRLSGYLDLVVRGKAPWVLHEMEWDAAFLGTFRSGAGSGRDWPALAAMGVGAGDLCIAAEVLPFQARTGAPASVWSLDEDLSVLLP